MLQTRRSRHSSSPRFSVMITSEARCATHAQRDHSLQLSPEQRCGRKRCRKTQRDFGRNRAGWTSAKRNGANTLVMVRRSAEAFGSPPRSKERSTTRDLQRSQISSPPISIRTSSSGETRSWRGNSWPIPIDVRSHRDAGTRGPPDDPTRLFRSEFPTEQAGRG